ncbi:hypothetical protein [Occallatibacter riparius]|uniref:Uncharacterized protein n=1 Tax=Occallatibacter riparius TaxID=1002689 RepID=A0A9J7BNA0_9BACT|nr:hypothetical protein [Occallatibacter riparius]UWZ84187.1 hypothetical protein MOP44_27000 [Occallatibacter riparius]
MPKEPKTPQEKKLLELKKDYFTFSRDPHAFRKTWKRKKVLANQEYRRKSAELFAHVTPGASAEDVELVVGDVTTSHLQKGIARTKLIKWGTVSLGEKIKAKLEKREQTVGRRANRHRLMDAITASAVTTLGSLEENQLTDVVRRIALLLRGGDPMEWARLYQSSDPLDRAIFFVERLSRGDSYYVDALRRNPKLCHSFQRWRDKANRILAKLRRPHERKLEQKVAAAKKIKALRRAKAKDE